MNLERLEKQLSEAVASFWNTRQKQLDKGGGDTQQQYAGTRGAVVGGSHLNGFIGLVREILKEGGLKDLDIYPNSKPSVIPGFFRPTKEWDLIVVSRGELVAAVEFKSQVGSFGNNFNNRVEEALGNATDIHTAYEKGAFAPSREPWVGYLMLLEECEKSTSKLRVQEPHFKVFDEWRDASYVRRYELFCEKLIRRRLYNAACLITSNKQDGPSGRYREPSGEVGFRAFASSLIGQAVAFSTSRK